MVIEWDRSMLFFSSRIQIEHWSSHENWNQHRLHSHWRKKTKEKPSPVVKSKQKTKNYCSNDCSTSWLERKRERKKNKTDLRVCACVWERDDCLNRIFTFLSVNRLFPFSIIGQTIACLLNIHESRFGFLFFFRILAREKSPRLDTRRKLRAVSYSISIWVPFARQRTTLRFNLFLRCIRFQTKDLESNK